MGLPCLRTWQRPLQLYHLGIIMKQFEVGKIYTSNVCYAEIEITKRTAKMIEYKFVSVAVTDKYRAKIRYYENLEYIIIMLGTWDISFAATDERKENEN